MQWRWRSNRLRMAITLKALQGSLKLLAGAAGQAT
jgi:hypothetical protein